MTAPPSPPPADEQPAPEASGPQPPPEPGEPAAVPQPAETDSATPATASGPPEPPPPRRRIGRRLVRLALAATLLLAAAYAARNALLAPLAVRTLARVLAREQPGLRLEVRRVTGGWLRTLRLEDVTLTAPAPFPIRELRIEQLVLQHDPRALLDGLERWWTSAQIEIDRARVVLAPAPGTPSATARPRPPHHPPALPSRLPAVRVHALAFSLALPHGPTIETPRLDLELAPPPRPGSPQRLTLHAAPVHWRDVALGARRARLALEARYHAGAVRLERLTLRSGPDTLELAGWVALGALEAGAVGWRVSGRIDGAPLTITGGWAPQGLDSDLALHELDTATLLRWLPAELQTALRPLAPRGRLSLHARGHLPAHAPARARARGSLGIERLRIAGREPMRGSLGLVVRGGWLAAHGRVLQPHNRLEITDLSFPLAVTRPADLLREARGTLALAVQDLPAIVRPGAREAPPHRLALALSLRAGTLRVREGHFTVAGGRFVFRDGELVLPYPAGPERGGPRYRTSIDVQLPELAPLGKLLTGSDRWRGRVVGRADARGRGARAHARIEARGEAVAIEDYEIGSFAVHADLEHDRLAIERLAVHGPLATGHIRGGLDLHARRFEDLEAELDIHDLATLTGGRLHADALRCRLEARGAWSAPSGRLEVNGAALQADGWLLTEFALRARGEDRRVQIERLYADSPFGTLELAGAGRYALSPWRVEARLERLGLARGGAALLLQAPAAVSASAHTLHVPALALRGSAGALRLSVHHGPDASEARLATEALGIGAWLDPWWPTGWSLGTLDLEAHATGPREGHPWSVRCTGRLTDLRPPLLPHPLAWRWTASADVHTIRIERLLALEGERVALHARGHLPTPQPRHPLAPGPVALWLYVAPTRLDAVGELPRRLGLPPGSYVAGRGQLTAELGGSWRALAGTVSLQLDELEIDRGLRPYTPFPAFEQTGSSFGPARLELLCSVAPDATRLELARLEAPGQLQLTAHGRLAAPSDLEALLSRHARLGDRPLQLDTRLEVPRLGWLAELTPAIRRCGGWLQAQLAAAGTLRQPQLTGRIALHDGELRLASSLPALERIEAHARLEGERVVLERLHAEAGAQPVAARGSLVGWRRPRLDLRLRGRDVLLLREHGIKLRADLDAHARGPIAALTVTGTATLTDARYVRRIEWLQLPLAGEPIPTNPGGLALFSITEAPFSAARFDIAVRARAPVRIDNNLLHARLRPDLRLRGTGAVPVLVGTVALESARVALPTTTVVFDGGTITFDEADPFFPRLLLHGRTRMLGYDITIEVEGSYDQPEITLASVPALEQTDLLTLLLTGRPPREDRLGRTGLRAGRAIALYVAKDVLAALLDSESAEAGESLLDRLTLEFGRDVTRSGGETIEARFRIADHWLTSRDTVYLTAEQDAYDHFGGGLRLVFRFR